MSLIDCRSYIHKIRSPLKKEYAKDYLHELQWGEEVDEEPKYDELSYMAKQGMRMRMDELYDLP